MPEAIQTADFLTALQAAIVTRLEDDDQIKGPPHIAVITEDLGNIETEIQRALGPIGSGGGAVIVSLPEVQPANDRLPGIVSVTLLVQTLENTIINRSDSGNKVQTSRLAEIVFAMLQNWEPGDGWSALRRTTWQAGKTDKGDLGAAITFATETMLVMEDVPTT